MVKYLIDHGADINQKQYKDSTPIYIASIIGHIHIVEYLLSKGANINIKNSEGKSPIETTKTEAIRNLLKSHHDKG